MSGSVVLSMIASVNRVSFPSYITSNPINLIYSEIPSEAILLPKSSGTRGHKGDAFLQCDRGYFYL